MLVRDVYIDVGSAKTGSSRTEFTRMIEDCKSGKLNYLVMKSMSRFTRDMLDNTESTRLLKEAGVTIYFLLEDREIKRDTPEFEQTIAALSIQAENESRSANIKIGLRNGAESGKSKLYKRPCYGYKKDEDGNLVVDLYPATVVQQIYEWYLDGKSEAAIIEELAKMNIKTPQGKDKWCKRAIETILTNEKYTGNVAILKVRGNRGSFYVPNAHEAIISHEMFEKAQEEMVRRAKRKRREESFSSQYIRDLKNI